MDFQESEIVQMHAIVKGYVQGVAFRDTTQYFARELGITGTVRNLPDGSVEIYAQGTKEALEKLMNKLQGESGPGKVTSVSKEFGDPARHFEDFHITF